MRLITLFIALMFCLASYAQTDTLKISTAYTTHIIFSTDVTYADLSNNRIVAAKVVEQNRNILAIKARCPFEETTSISALEANGTMHTYIVAYEESPKTLIIDERETEENRARGGEMRANVTSNRRSDAPTLSQMSSSGQRIHHIGAREYGITALCENIVSYSDITYITLSVQNKSGVSYDIKDATFVLESKKRGKRSVVIEKTIFPEGRHGSLNCPVGEKAKMAYSFKKITLSKDQVLKIYLYEHGGQRNLEMTIDTNDINKAERSL
jgi:conjugative transposon TraN protein